LRKLAAALLAVPVLLVVYVVLPVRRSVAARRGLALGAGALLGIAAIVVTGPAPSVATPPSEVGPVADARFGTALRVNHSPREAIAIEFATPMDVASVESSLSVDPPAAVALDWSADRTRLLVRPTAGWDPGTYYTVTVDPTASDEAGATLRGPARAAFYVRPTTAGRIAVAASADRADGKVTPNVPFSLDFDRPVTIASLERAFTIDPPVEGSFEVGTDIEAGSDREHVRFIPATPLQPGTTYTLTLAGDVVDADGASLGPVAPLTVTTVDAPGVVRFRPVVGTSEVAPDAAVSVRFTQPMERSSTARAFAVSVDGTPVKGKVRWAEKDTVLVFDPVAALPAGATVAVTVSEKARSRDGVALERSKAGTFTTEKPKPKAKPKAPPTAPAKPKPTKPPAATPIKPDGSVGSGNWRGVETYLLKLLNCTRTGGWVTSSGSCSSPGGRNVAPLALDTRISSSVARPYAKRLATSGACTHFSDGNPGTRLRRAGFVSYRWAENIGCRSASPYRAALGSHLFFQSEKPWNGGHYRNLMNPVYTRVGIGVWVVGGRVRFVVDFYRP
jgi:uncharacterized protein YkwD